MMLQDIRNVQHEIEQSYVSSFTQFNGYMLPIYRKRDNWLHGKINQLLIAQHIHDSSIFDRALTANVPDIHRLQYKALVDFNNLNFALASNIEPLIIQTLLKHKTISNQIKELFVKEMDAVPTSDKKTFNEIHKSAVGQYDSDYIETKVFLPSATIEAVIAAISLTLDDTTHFTEYNPEPFKSDIVDLLIRELPSLYLLKIQKQKDDKETARFNKKNQKLLKMYKKKLPDIPKAIEQELTEYMGQTSHFSLVGVTLTNALSLSQPHRLSTKIEKHADPDRSHIPGMLLGSSFVDTLAAYIYVTQVSDDPLKHRTSIRIPFGSLVELPYFSASLFKTIEQSLIYLAETVPGKNAPVPIETFVTPRAKRKDRDKDVTKTYYEASLNELATALTVQPFVAKHPELIGNITKNINRIPNEILNQNLFDNHDESAIQELFVDTPFEVYKRLHKDVEPEEVYKGHLSNVLKRTFRHALIVNEHIDKTSKDQQKAIEGLKQDIKQKHAQVQQHECRLKIRDVKITKLLSDVSLLKHQLEQERASNDRIAELERENQKQKEQIQTLNDMLLDVVSRENDIPDTCEDETVQNIVSDDTLDAMTKDLSELQIAVVGGHDNWHANLIKQLPDTRIVKAEHINTDFSFLHTVDVLVINVSILNHSIYHKVKNQIKRQTKKTKIVYLNTQGSNIPLTIQQLHQQIKGV